MTAFQDLQAIDSIFGSFKEAEQATNEMALAYNALTSKQQAFVMSQIGEKTELGIGLKVRASHTSAISACASAEATALLTKNGLTAAEAELLSEKVRETLQTKLQADAVEELTEAELKQIIVETAAANNLGAFSDAQASLLAQLLQPGKAADNASKSFTSFGNVAGQSLKALVSSLLFIITTVITVVNIAVNLIKKVCRYG